MDINGIEIELQKLEIKDGDVLIVKTDPLPLSSRERIADTLKVYAEINKGKLLILFLTKEQEIEHLNPEQFDYLAKQKGYVKRINQGTTISYSNNQAWCPRCGEIFDLGGFNNG